MAMKLADAVQQALDAKGTELLQTPKLFVSMLADLCGSVSLDVSVLVRSCDEELLLPFATVA